jgi:hypothetical protein
MIRMSIVVLERLCCSFRELLKLVGVVEGTKLDSSRWNLEDASRVLRKRRYFIDASGIGRIKMDGAHAQQASFFE